MCVIVLFYVLDYFLFKQKTAYELRISDWSSDVGSSDLNLLVRADASVVEEATIERIVIRGTTHIGDVASVFYGPAEATSYVRLDGRPVIGLGVIRQAQSNTIKISEAVDQAVERMNRQLRDIHIVTHSDDAVFIRGAVKEIMLPLGLGVAIVIQVLIRSKLGRATRK